MKVLLPDESPVQDLIERRRRLGQDLYDEMWDGVYHVAAAPRWEHSDVQARVVGLLLELAGPRDLRAGGPFNLGEPHDFRVPDAGLVDAGTAGAWVARARLVVEVLSPGDETFDKLDFYATRVDELLVVDPDGPVRCYLANAGEMVETLRSAVLGFDVAEIAKRLGLS